MTRWMRGLWGNSDGAVAPMVALSLVGLIAAGGLAFDYAHMAAMHTELQNAADQAALAAATQLDGGSDAQTRATAAAQSLLRNSTMFASDAGGDDSDERKVTISDVHFYKSYDDATETFGDAATAGSDARVVEVVVGGRTADYALTPIVGLFSSGSISARAAASLASAVCNVPPLMMCVPSGTEFPTASDIGKGVLLQPGPNVGAWAPGDYGYMDFGNGASGVSTNLGVNNETGGCVDMSNGIPTEPGNKASVTDSLNSRFDLYPASANACNASTGNYCPSQNTQKDLAKTYEVDVNGTSGTVPTNPLDTNCAGTPGAKLVDTSNSIDKNGGFSLGTPPQGMPRDDCHISGTCTPSAKFGNGTWGRDLYLGAINGTTASAVAAAIGKTTATLTRYDVYKWQLADAANRLKSKSIPVPGYPTFKANGASANGKWTFRNRCTFPQPVNGTGVAASTSQKDRRVLTVAAVDCTGMNGKSNVIVKEWVDVFLVEPSLTRTTPTSAYATGKEQIYVEIAGLAKKPNGQSAFQFYLRQRPRLIR